MTRALTLLVAAALAAGCATAPAPHVDEARRLPPLGAYAFNPFVPVNLYFNANEHLDAERAALVEHAARRLAESKAFVRVDRGVQRWPITLQAVYRVEDVAVSWRTRLGLAPKTRRHTLVVEVFEEPESIATIELSTESTGQDRAAVEALLERLLADIATHKRVPRWKDFEPEPPAKKKKAPRGRAT